MLCGERNSMVAKLADFGLAEKLDQEFGGQNDRSAAGTTGYLAPEIIAGYPYGAPSDIWSFGCLLYAMLTVTLPSENILSSVH